MHLGLIAGNGRFPFLVLDAARGAGHTVTIVALKEETFPELAEAAGVQASSIGTLLARAEAEFERRFRARYGDAL